MGRVLAPGPYFPFQAQRFGAYGTLARVPRREVRFGIEVDHPRYLAIPKCGMSLAPYLLYAGARSEEHTSELQSLMRISYAVFCLNKKIQPSHDRGDRVTEMSVPI